MSVFKILFLMGDFFPLSLALITCKWLTFLDFLSIITFFNVIVLNIFGAFHVGTCLFWLYFNTEKHISMRLRLVKWGDHNF